LAPAATPPYVLAPGAALEALEPCYPVPPALLGPYPLLFCLADVASGGLAGEPLFDVLPIPTPLGDVPFFFSSYVIFISYVLIFYFSYNKVIYYKL